MYVISAIIEEQHCRLPDGLAEICANPDSYTSSTRHKIMNLLMNMKLSGNYILLQIRLTMLDTVHIMLKC